MKLIKLWWFVKSLTIALVIVGGTIVFGITVLGIGQ